MLLEISFRGTTNAHYIIFEKNGKSLLTYLIKNSVRYNKKYSVVIYKS